ncbi:hypothetical protein BLNAU_23483 [Blattamonas nauphoetae]|uniref:Uncharacterized protein n=1 Tax=Blattamonas nauphoetae TaxID=2049346 RepID=A0ABQ9WT37_9EUKA|nr:hypothetical protein BLNAU_23483 [Blattamonas nauphoetae]
MNTNSDTDLQHFNKLSQDFQSFVGFIKGGAEIEFEDALDGSALLKKIQDQAFLIHSPNLLIFDLVPKPDRSGSGFAEAMVLLLTSSDEMLVQSTFKFLRYLLDYTLSVSHFDIIDAGFFALLPTAFYEQEMHLLAKPDFWLMEIVGRIMSCLHSGYSREICEYRQVLPSRQTVSGDRVQEQPPIP